MIIRVAHRRRYTVIADAALRDRRLSFRATGVLAYLLSLPDGSEVSGRRLADAKSEGRDAVLKALAELDDAGYLTRTRQQIGAGRWTTTVTISESPSPENPDSVAAENPPSPSPEKPNPENQDSKAFSTSHEYLDPPGIRTPIWDATDQWQDEKGRWFVGPKPAPPREESA